MTKDNASKKLIKKYGWRHLDGWSWDYGLVFEKHCEQIGFKGMVRVITYMNGIQVETSGYIPQYPIITYDEIKLFKVISKYYKDDFDKTSLAELKERLNK